MTLKTLDGRQTVHAWLPSPFSDCWLCQLFISAAPHLPLPSPSPSPSAVCMCACWTFCLRFCCAAACYVSSLLPPAFSFPVRTSLYYSQFELLGVSARLVSLHAWHFGIARKGGRREQDVTGKSGDGGTHGTDSFCGLELGAGLAGGGGGQEDSSSTCSSHLCMWFFFPHHAHCHIFGTDMCCS